MKRPLNGAPYLHRLKVKECRSAQKRGRTLKGACDACRSCLYVWANLLITKWKKFVTSLQADAAEVDEWESSLAPPEDQKTIAGAIK
jgi:hypothetical protein